MTLFICNICNSSVEEACKSIFCNICKSWIHLKICSNLSETEFEALAVQSNGWACQACLNTALPFSNSPKIVKTNSTRCPKLHCDDYTKVVISDLNKVIHQQDDDIDNRIFNSNTCKYYECEDFNKLNISSNSFSAFHLNIASMNSHYDELRALLASLQFEFSVIGITESRFLKGFSPLLDYSFEGYSCLDTPTETSAGGVHFTFQNVISLIDVVT